MCSRIQCKECGKPSFVGCGMHVEQVLGDVPRADRCSCHSQPKASKVSRPKASSRFFSWLRDRGGL